MMHNPDTPVAAGDPIERLFNDRRWVCWRRETVKGEERKVPYTPGTGSRASSTNPSTWRTYEEACATLAKGNVDGIGYVLTGRDDVAAFDLDHCRAPGGGELSTWAQALVARAASYTEITPSEDGLRIIGYANGAADAHFHLPRGPNGEKVEVYYRPNGRYITFTHRTLGEPRPLNDISALLKEMHAERARGAKPATAGRICLTVEPLVADTAGEEMDRSKRFFLAVIAAVRAGMSPDELESMMRRHPEGCAVKYLRPTDRLRTEIDRAWGKVDADSDKAAGVMLGDFVAYMPMGNKFIFKPVGDVWPGSSVDNRLPKVQLLEADGTLVTDDKGNPVKLRASVWLSSHMPVEQMTWAPGYPEEVEGKLVSDGGWINRPGCVVFNLYRPATIRPRAGDVSPWLDLVHRVFPDEAEHIIKWFAQRVQQPHIKINHGILLGGAPGIGKDTIMEPVKQAVGPWNFEEVGPPQLLGQFNQFLRRVILRVSEVHDLGEYDRFALHERMKTMLAAPPDTLRINEKHRCEYSIFNVVGLIITTNHKTDGIYLPADDRRTFVAWSEAEREDFDTPYWDSIYGWFEAGGNEAVAAYLHDLDIREFNPKAPPPKTPAFWEIVNANRAPEDAEMADALEKLGWPDATTLQEVIAYSSEEFSDWLRERKNAKRAAHRLEACGYVAVNNDGSRDGRWKVGGQHRAVYARKRLSVRDRWTAAAKLAGYT